MIRRSTPVPAKFTRSFGLSKDNLTRLRVSVVEGESSVPLECCHVGVCEIELPEALPSGTPVSLTYCYTESQVLEVMVEVAGHMAQATIARQSGIPPAEMIQAASDLQKIGVA
jgi:molecular chaperone DnaK (HSP70)